MQPIRTNKWYNKARYNKRRRKKLDKLAWEQDDHAAQVFIWKLNWLAKTKKLRLRRRQFMEAVNNSSIGFQDAALTIADAGASIKRFAFEIRSMLSEWGYEMNLHDGEIKVEPLEELSGTCEGWIEEVTRLATYPNGEPNMEILINNLNEEE